MFQMLDEGECSGAAASDGGQKAEGEGSDQVDTAKQRLKVDDIQGKILKSHFVFYIILLLLFSLFRIFPTTDFFWILQKIYLHLCVLYI